MVSSESTSRNCIECTTKPGPSKLMTSTSNGRIRLFSPEGDRSALATISLETTAADLAKAYEVDSIYLQIGNLHIRCYFIPEKRRDMETFLNIWSSLCDF
ncbi:unnamed protein product [Nippostrongylus brasiliensis]|uniref:Transcription factor WD40-like family n=1 Tax=Nippostrongylus brasiliensis TaxID=27835 RepID=A0A0N4XX77_NIPBR|nr:unnamed protein product [Nippostrongylus brasiliensis]